MDKYEFSNFKCQCGVCAKCDPESWFAVNNSSAKMREIIKLETKMDETFTTMMNVQHKIAMLTDGKEQFYIKQNKDLHSIKLTEDEAAWILGKKFADLKTELVFLKGQFEKVLGEL